MPGKPRDRKQPLPIEASLLIGAALEVTETARDELERLLSHETAGQRLIRVASERNENPYLLAYAWETGAKTGVAALERDKSNVRYTQWNEKIWEQQTQVYGCKREFTSTMQGAHEFHCEIIANRVKVFVHLTTEDDCKRHGKDKGKGSTNGTPSPGKPNLDHP